MIVYNTQMYEKTQVVVSLILTDLMNTNCWVCLYVNITMIPNDFVFQQ